ncbi:NADPH-dependent FMN reductase [Pseudomonas nitroreducens]|uniref:NADPH-dependent FMN reductase n=1 Tax=Pseudomonas nitroreducens TaxID=46680 RepID=UPI002D7F3394|nr:NADPH-dependent FMN reductase [Pseudomonas nitroreducens]
MNLLAISGSARQGSSNTALLNAMKEAIPTQINICVMDRLDCLPVFSPDREGGKTPVQVNDLLSQVDSAEGIVISSPEYIRAIPGGLKNAIDWMVSRPEIVGKPIALAHASHRGHDMLCSLRLVLSTVSEAFLEAPFLCIPLLGMPPEEVDRLLQQPSHKLEIQEFLLNFTSCITRIRAEKAR